MWASYNVRVVSAVSTPQIKLHLPLRHPQPDPDREHQIVLRPLAPRFHRVGVGQLRLDAELGQLLDQDGSVGQVAGNFESPRLDVAIALPLLADGSEVIEASARASKTSVSRLVVRGP